MAYMLIEMIKDKFGKDKEALELYEKQTGKEVKTLYADFFLGNGDLKGTLYEFYVFKQLYKTKGYHKFLFNVYIPTKTGTTEIDVLFIHETGIYVFECKNYGGRIYGKENNKNWYQYLGKDKISFYNPILQNKGHIKHLKEYLTEKESDNIFSFISFSVRAELKVDYDPIRLIVATTDECISELKYAIRKFDKHFNSEEIDDLYNRLYPFCDVSQEVKEKHIEAINTIKGIKAEEVSEEKEEAVPEEIVEDVLETIEEDKQEEIIEEVKVEEKQEKIINEVKTEETVEVVQELSEEAKEFDTIYELVRNNNYKKIMVTKNTWGYGSICIVNKVILNDNDGNKAYGFFKFSKGTKKNGEIPNANAEEWKLIKVLDEEIQLENELN